MVDKIDMSLDDIIKANKTNPRRGGGGGGRGGGLKGRRGGGGGGPGRGSNGQRSGSGAGVGGGGGGGGGGVLKGRKRGGITRAKYSRGDVNSTWKHDMFDGGKNKNIRSAGLGASAKLLVSNLDYAVSESDVNELFADFGPLKSASVHYDRSGRSLGTADVVFERKADALKAMKQYNGVPLDGRPMNIQLATSEVPATSAVVSTFNRNRVQNNGGSSGGGGGGSGGAQAKPRVGRGNTSRGGARGGGGGRTGGRGANTGPAPTAEELDAELDAYAKDMK